LVDWLIKKDLIVQDKKKNVVFKWRENGGKGEIVGADRQGTIAERDIFIDKQSGKDFEREQYQFLKRMLRKGDILYIHSLDRFGRNKEAILQEWKEITKDIQAHIVVLDMPLLDTTKYQDSLGNFITDLVLQILSWLAQEERERTKKRQREGIAEAKKVVKHLGRYIYR